MGSQSYPPTVFRRWTLGRQFLKIQTHSFLAQQIGDQTYENLNTRRNYLTCSLSPTFVRYRTMLSTNKMQTCSLILETSKLLVERSKVEKYLKIMSNQIVKTRSLQEVFEYPLHNLYRTKVRLIVQELQRMTWHQLLYLRLGLFHWTIKSANLIWRADEILHTRIILKRPKQIQA